MESTDEFFDAIEPDCDQEQYYENEQVRRHCVQELREWAMRQPHFVNCRLDDNFLLRFLRMRKFNITLAQQVLDKYLTVKTKFPHCYQRLDIQDPGIRDLISRGYVFPLPERDKDGRVVLFCIAGALDSSKHKQTDVFRSFVLTFEALMENEINQKRGLSYIFTQEGYQLSHAFLVGLRDLQKMVQIGEKSLPVRHKILHWVNVPIYLAKLFTILKTFLSQKLQERIVLHYTLDSLYKSFPASMLPKEYGGTIPVCEMTAKWIAELDKKRDRMLAQDRMRVDENKRPPHKKERKNHFYQLVNNITRMDIY